MLADCKSGLLSFTEVVAEAESEGALFGWASAELYPESGRSLLLMLTFFYGRPTGTSDDCTLWSKVTKISCLGYSKDSSRSSYTAIAWSG